MRLIFFAFFEKIVVPILTSGGYVGLSLKHEFFAAAWMKFFDAEFLYQYVEGANQYWKMELDHNSLFKICGLNKEVNTIRLHIARIVELVEKMFGKVMEAK